MTESRRPHRPSRRTSVRNSTTDLAAEAPAASAIPTVDDASGEARRASPPAAKGDRPAPETPSPASAKRKRAARGATARPAAAPSAAVAVTGTPTQPDPISLQAGDPIVPPAAGCGTDAAVPPAAALPRIAREALPRPASHAPPSTFDPAAQLRAWRQQQADRLDPLRFAYMQALHRRGATLTGMARELAMQRLSALMDGYTADLAQACHRDDHAPRKNTAHGRQVAGPEIVGDAPQSPLQDPAHQAADRGVGPVDAEQQPGSHPASSDAGPAPRGQPPSAALAALVQTLQQHRRPQDAATTRPPATPLNTLSEALSGADQVSADASAAVSASVPPPGASVSMSTQAAPLQQDIHALQQLWNRVRNEGQLREAAKPAPRDAGPLNSITLVHRAVQLMRELSPGYLRHFLAYLDDLAWLGELQGDTSATKPAPAILSSRRGRRIKPKSSGRD